LTLCLPLILRSLPGVTKGELGSVLSAGYAVYATGKLLNGILADRLGGAPVFIIGWCGSMLAIAVMIAIPCRAENLSWYALVWAINRYFQSAGWASLVNCLVHWFHPSEHGWTLGTAAVSYGLGEVVIRLCLGWLLSVFEGGYNHDEPHSNLTSDEAREVWHSVFWVSVMCAGVLGLPALVWLRSTPEAYGLPPIATESYEMLDLHPSNNESLNVGAAAAANNTQSQQVSISGFVWNTLKLPRFWCLMVIALCVTMIRETFSSWLTLYLSDVVGLTDSDAGMASLLFPLFGTMATVLGGWLMDRETVMVNRSRVPTASLMILSMCLFAMGNLSFKPPFISVAVLVSASAFFVMGPYSFVEGVLMLSLTGGAYPGVAVGMVNCMGYLGAILAGHQVGEWVEFVGWAQVFMALSFLAVLSTLAQIAYWWFDLRDVLTQRGTVQRQDA
jgi:sugar phosphate permease